VLAERSAPDRSAPAELVKAIVVDPEVVGDLVQDGVAHQLGEVPSVPGTGLEWPTEQRDPVGEQWRMRVAGRPRCALVETEQDLVSRTHRVGGWHVGDVDLHVAQVGQEVARQRRDRVIHESREAVHAGGPGTVDRPSTPVDVTAAVSCVALEHARKVASIASGPEARSTSLPNDTRVVYGPRVQTFGSHDVIDAAPGPRPSPRRCVRPGCTRDAASTLRFDYAARTVMLDALTMSASPGSYDLCFRHAARSNPPSGWTMRDRAPSPEPATDPTPPVGPSRDHGVDRLAAALRTVPGSASEGAPDAAPVRTDRSVPHPALRPTTSAPDRGPSTAAATAAPAAPVVPIPVPQPLRLAPAPTSSVWCADLLPAEGSARSVTSVVPGTHR
jgi:hypothetical protein